ncbi:MAG: helix-turn-helix domain-containing protein, partial [Pseudomonadota bacterium]
KRSNCRLFKKHTGVSPVRYYLDVRLDRARGLITQTELPILNVAVACGFSTNAQFSRTYKKRFGIAPSRDRIEGRVPFQFRSFPSHAGV